MKMQNARIQSQNRGCHNGKKFVEFFEVIADTERFGRNEIMYQGDFKGCVKYLADNGVTYDAEYCFTTGRRDSFQAGNQMYHRAGITDDKALVGYSRSDYGLAASFWLDQIAIIGPMTGRVKLGKKTVTVKFGNRATW